MRNFFLFFKRLSIFIVLVILQFFLSGNTKHEKNIPKQLPEERHWTGTITLEERYTGITGTSERQVTVSFNNALPTLHRDIETTELNFTDDKGTGSETFHGETIIEGKKIGISDYQGSGQTELHIVDMDNESYYIHAIGPRCTGTDIDLINGTTTTVETNGTDITISERLGTRRDILSGAKTETKDMGGGVGTVTTIITWHLTRSTVSDVELILTPEKYNDWLPEPGMNDLSVGSVMNISLKLQARGGGPTTRKAKAFELKLSNTSREPGVTINFPTVPWGDPMPDLRFLIQPNAGVGEEFQVMKISCPGGCQSSQFKVGAYDGGGWSTLTAEAILQDDSRIQGKLFVSAGETDIRIPKRDPNSKIGMAWLASNSNPGEMDDKETSTGNSNNGDGLTAYEEYRGVISEGKFKRLDPNKKELGVKLKRSEFSLFSPGLKLFESATFIKAIPFLETEISRDRRLNKNANSAHIYDQYVLRLENRNLPNGIVGTAYRGPDIPANTDPVVIDWSQIQTTYQFYVRNANPARLLYTQAEMFAWAVSHELAHGVNAFHHGPDLKEPDQVAQPIDPTRIFYANGNPAVTRPYSLRAIGRKGSVESGNISCIMAYSPYYLWGYTVGADGAKIFNEVPLLPVANIMCNSKAGTGINATQLYFGDALKGNCLSQLKLK